HGHGLHALAAFDEPRRAVAARCPQPAALPARIGVVDAAVESLGVETEGVGHPQRDHLAVLERDQPVHEVGGRDRHVLAEPERVVLIDPAGVAGLRAILADALEAGARILVKGPALRAMIAGCFRSVERALALAPVEAAHVPARERHPHYALAVDITAARPKTRPRYIVDFGERGLRRVRAGIEPHDRSRTRARAERAPDGAVDWARHHRVEHLADALVLVGIDRIVGPDILVALAVAIRVEDERGPPLRFRGVASLIEQFGVEPAYHPAAAAARGPQRVVGVVAELQVMRLEAGVDEGVF